MTGTESRGTALMVPRSPEVVCAFVKSATQFNCVFLLWLMRAYDTVYISVLVLPLRAALTCSTILPDKKNE